MALLAPQTLDVDGLKPTFTSAAGGGDTIKAADDLMLMVANGDASAKTVTIVRPGAQFGQANPDVSRSIPAGEMYLFRVPREFRDTDGLIDITYSAATSVTVALVKT